MLQLNTYTDWVYGLRRRTAWWSSFWFVKPRGRLSELISPGKNLHGDKNIAPWFNVMEKFEIRAAAAETKASQKVECRLCDEA